MPLKTDLEPDADYEQKKNWIVQDTIVTYSGSLFKVTKVARVNFQVVDEQGNRFNLRRAGFVQRAPRQGDWAGAATVNAYSSDFKLGTPVRPTSNRLRDYAGNVYVVIAISSDNSFRIAKLGGTPKNTYLKGILPTELELVKGSFQEED